MSPNNQARRRQASPHKAKQMLQSAIFADLQVNNFGIPTVRFAPHLPVIGWAKVSFAQVIGWLRGNQSDLDLLSAHLRRDIEAD